MSINPKVVSFERSSAYVHHRAMVNRRENNEIDALELMRHAVERSPENREYRLDLAELYCEMGCHEQSSRLLLDMLAQNDPPSECYYGLALNQLGLNDLEGAQRSLRKYRSTDPEGMHAGDVNRLAAELDIFDAMNRPVNRKLYRAICVSDHACDAMHSGEYHRAKRLFERSLSLSSEQYEMRALYAMTLMLMGLKKEALAEAERAAKGFPPSVRAICVSAQVMHSLGETGRAQTLLRKVMEEHPDGVEMRLLIHSLCELEMHYEASECARLALQQTPYDRGLLHIRAVALHRLGRPDRDAERFWLRILRIDPEDSIARFHQEAAAAGTLKEIRPEYPYQVPQAEYERRFQWLAERVSGGLSGVQQRWAEEPEFRSMIQWAAGSDDEKLRRVAVTVIAAMEDETAKSALRTLMFGKSLQPELKMHAASLVKLRGAEWREVFPADPDSDGTVLPEGEDMLEGLMVGERQLLRYAADALAERYGFEALSELTLIWAVYRRHRNTRMDPLTDAESVAAALVYLYLNRHDYDCTVEEISGFFRCGFRRVNFYISRIVDIMERYEGEMEDENL